MLPRRTYHKGFKSRRETLRDWRDEPPAETRQWYVWMLDRLVSLIVRRRDGFKCVICGSRYQPQAAHIFSRKNFAARWDLENVHCNCDGCNRRHNEDENPYVFWFVNKFGPERFAALRDRALSGVKVETWQMVELLEQLKREYPLEAKAVERKAA